jgi:hypothetical protein
MLMQEAEVRSSAGQHVRSHSSKNVAVFLKCVRPQRRCVRPQKSTASLSGVRARTQVRGARTQARGARTQKRGARTQQRCARTQKRCARTQMRERAGRGSSAFDRKNCVRPHCRCLIFQTHRQKAKND